MKHKIFSTPLGWAGVAATDAGLLRIVLPKKSRKEVEQELTSSELRVRSSESTAESSVERKKSKKSIGHIDQWTRLLQKYFSGRRVRFGLPLDLRYYTPFQQAVWKAASAIRFGETRSYSWIANRIKNPKAVRAVGQAMGANPVPIVVPCHRVIGASGSLCGFAGGLALKKKLLDLESRKTAARKARITGLRA